MKRRDLKELTTKSKEELIKMLKEYQDEVEKITIQEKAGRLKNVMLSSQKRKDIARILTMIRNKEIKE